MSTSGVCEYVALRPCGVAPYSGDAIIWDLVGLQNIRIVRFRFRFSGKRNERRSVTRPLACAQACSRRAQASGKLWPDWVGTERTSVGTLIRTNLPILESRLHIRGSKFAIFVECLPRASLSLVRVAPRASVRHPEHIKTVPFVPVLYLRTRCIRLRGTRVAPSGAVSWQHVTQSPPAVQPSETRRSLRRVHSYYRRLA